MLRLSHMSNICSLQMRLWEITRREIYQPKNGIIHHFWKLYNVAARRLGDKTENYILVDWISYHEVFIFKLWRWSSNVKGCRLCKQENIWWTGIVQQNSLKCARRSRGKMYTYPICITSASTAHKWATPYTALLRQGSVQHYMCNCLI
jgi:hypothetical protein